jgi:hypothetical protein
VDAKPRHDAIFSPTLPAGHERTGGAAAPPRQDGSVARFPACLSTIACRTVSGGDRIPCTSPKPPAKGTSEKIACHGDFAGLAQFRQHGGNGESALGYRGRGRIQTAEPTPRQATGSCDRCRRPPMRLQNGHGLRFHLVARLPPRFGPSALRPPARRQHGDRRV